jgi:predicted branched-subunit amino acid permease
LFPSYSDPRGAFRGGVREALGVPALVLSAGYVGFGAFAADTGFSLVHAVLCTLAIWALPGQLVLLEMANLGAPALAIVTTVMLTAARFLPMTVSLMPMLRWPGQAAWRYFLAAHLLAMTGWAVAMRRCPDMPPPTRLSYFLGFSTAMVLSAAIATAAGFAASDRLGTTLKLGFVFMNPVFFIIVLAGDIRGRMMAASLAIGAIAGPLAYLYTPQWSVLVAGLGGGTLAFALTRPRSTR